MTQIRITGGQVLLGEDGLATTDLSLSDGRIDAIGGGGQAGQGPFARRLGPAGAARHRRHPRRRVRAADPAAARAWIFPPASRCGIPSAQLLANGITTAFHGVTLSWEPGLRSLDSWRALLAALEAERWTCDMRVHLRWEAYNLDALDTALADIAAGRVHLLAFNDHTPVDPEEAARPGRGRQIRRPRGHEDGGVPGLHRSHRGARR